MLKFISFSILNVGYNLFEQIKKLNQTQLNASKRPDVRKVEFKEAPCLNPWKWGFATSFQP